MEVILLQKKFTFHFKEYLISFNPCFYGSYSFTVEQFKKEEIGQVF